MSKIDIFTKRKLIQSIRKEYQEYIRRLFKKHSKNHFDVIINSSLKTLFYKEMFNYLLCEDIDEAYYIFILNNTRVNHTLEDLYLIFECSELNKSNEFLISFLEFKKNNEYRIKLQKEAVEILRGN